MHLVNRKELLGCFHFVATERTKIYKWKLWGVKFTLNGKKDFQIITVFMKCNEMSGGAVNLLSLEVRNKRLQDHLFGMYAYSYRG